MQVEMSVAEARAKRTYTDRLRRLTFGVRQSYKIDALDGHIWVDPVDKVFEARFYFAHKYGYAVLSRGSYVAVNARVNEVLIDGVDVPPLYQGDSGVLNFTPFESDNSWRSPLPCGEVRIKEFLGKRIGVVVTPDRSLRLADLGEGEQLAAFAEFMAESWAARPRLLVRFRGEDRVVRVSNVEGEMGMCRVDEHTKLALVPHSLGAHIEDARMALELVRFDDITQLAVLPVFHEGQRDILLWSDEALEIPTGAYATRGSQRPIATSVSPPVQPHGPLRPEIRQLVVRYLAELGAASGSARTLRRESAALLRCAESGVRLSGCGSSLRHGLESVGAFTITDGERSFQNFVKMLADDGILARDRPDGRGRDFVFDELHDLNTTAVQRLCARYGVTLPVGGTSPAQPHFEEAVPFEAEPRTPTQAEPPRVESPRTEPSRVETPRTEPPQADVTRKSPPESSKVADPQASDAPRKDERGTNTSPARNEVSPRDPRIAPRFLTIKPLHVWSPGAHDPKEEEPGGPPKTD